MADSDHLTDPASLPAADDLSATDKPYHSKRPHKKSRAGCRNCKTRKVKCDEGRPSCRTCRLRKVECIYAAPPAPAPAAAPASSLSGTLSSSSSSSTAAALAVTQQHNEPPSPPPTDFPSPVSPNVSNWSLHYSPSPSPLLDQQQQQSQQQQAQEQQAQQQQQQQLLSPGVVSEILFRPSSVDATEMKLLWFYTTETCRSFSVKTGGGRAAELTMRGPLVQHAFQNPFLMNTILALAGLHLQSLGQEQEGARAVGNYRSRAFEGYRKAIEDAKPESFPALMANSLIIVALASQTFRDPRGKDLYIIDWMVVWKGIKLMMDMIKVSTVFQSGLQGLFYRPPLNLDDAEPAIPPQLLLMVSSAMPGDPDFSDVGTYYDTLRYLGALYLHMREGAGAVDPTMKLRIVTWLTFLPDHFVELVRQERPRALVIVAHYAVFLKLLHDGIWWFRGVGDRTLHDIYNALSPEWGQYLTQPFLASQLRESSDIVRLLLGDDNPWTAPEKEQQQQQQQQDTPSFQLGIVDDMSRSMDSVQGAGFWDASRSNHPIQ